MYGIARNVLKIIFAVGKSPRVKDECCHLASSLAVDSARAYLRFNNFSKLKSSTDDPNYERFRPETQTRETKARVDVRKFIGRKEKPLNQANDKVSER